MKKLFDLKEWLTLEDAAKHLTILFGEEVKVSDVLRLALDGRLRLSVDFVNNTNVRTAKIVSIDEATFIDIPILQRKDASKPDPKNLQAVGHVKVLNGISYFDNKVINYDDDEKVYSLSGVWDLAMIGGERIDIEYKYHQLTGGPDVELLNIDGSFVVDEKRTVAMHLMKQFKEFVYDKNLSPEKNDENRRRNYYPAEGLPDDSVLVVRTSALRLLEDTIRDNQKKNDPPIRKSAATKAADTYLVIIAALAKKAGINIHEAGAANKIRRELDLLGIPMTEGTIYNNIVEVLPQVLADIPDAIGRRQKTTPKK